MSLVASLNVGVSALKTYSQGIQVISNNIANVSTTGYKASRAAYSDQFSNLLRPLVPNQSNGTKVPPTQIGGGVQVQGINAVFSQGTVQSSGNVSDLAITGAGFFRVRDIEGAKDYVTRAGNFRVSTDGTLATQDGYQVQGTFGAQTKVVYDAASGRFNVMGPQDTRNEETIESPSTITQAPSDQLSFDISPTSELAGIKVGMTVFGVVGGSPQNFGRVSKVEGSRVTVSGFGSLPAAGSTVTKLRFNVLQGLTKNETNIGYDIEVGDATEAEKLKVGQKVFDSSSPSYSELEGIITKLVWDETTRKTVASVTRVTALTTGPTVAATTAFFSVDGGYQAADQIGSVDIGFGVSGGRVRVVNTDGTDVSDVAVLAKLPGMKSFNVGPAGDIIVNLSNGQTFVTGRVLIQNFKDPNSLIRQGNNLFSGIDNAGPIGGTDLGTSGNTAGEDGLGLIQSASLEMSNVDLGQEFAEMITTQRSFQAGSRVISVSDQMLEEVVNLKR
jgi:flagellar hook protein FlgE